MEWLGAAIKGLSMSVLCYLLLTHLEPEKGLQNPLAAFSLALAVYFWGRMLWQLHKKSLRQQ